MKKIRWSWVFNAAVIITCVCLVLYFIFSEDGLNDLLSTDNNLSWNFLIMAFLCHVCNAFIDSVVTWQMTRQRYKRFSLAKGIRTAVTGHFFSAVTPGASGGQPMQMYLLKSLGVDLGFSSSMLLQKFIVFQTVSTVYAAVLFFIESKFIISRINGTFMILFVVIGFLSQLLVMGFIISACFMPKTVKKLVRATAALLKHFKFFRDKDIDEKVEKTEEKLNIFYTSNRRFIKRPLLMLTVFIEITIQVTLIYAVPYFVYKCLLPNGSGAALTMFCSVAFVNVVSSMIPIPGSSGVSELAFSVFFGAFFTPATLKSAVLIWRIITYYTPVLFGVPFALLIKKKDQPALKHIHKKGDCI